MSIDRDAPARAPRGAPSRLPSEDVVISAPMSYTGSAQRIQRMRRRARERHDLDVPTAAVVALTAVAWMVITVWYLMWGLLLVPYRLIRRRARRQRVEALRHRELMESLQGRDAPAPPAPVDRSRERVADSDRDRVAGELREHMLSGRLTVEELEERTAAAHRARTRRDLEELTDDLPAPAESRSAGWRMPR